RRSPRSPCPSVPSLLYESIHLKFSKPPLGSTNQRPRRMIVDRKIFLWKRLDGSFPRHPIPHRITPHGRRGPRLQRVLSARDRADRQALDGGGGQGTSTRTRAFQSAARGHPWNQRPRFDRTSSRAGDRKRGGKARRPGPTCASGLSTDG